MELTKCKNCAEVSICQHEELKQKLESSGMIVYCNLAPVEPSKKYDSMMKEIPGFNRWKWE